jgi:hypothetical protein
LISPETIEREGDLVKAADYDLLRKRYRDAIHCLFGVAILGITLIIGGYILGYIAGYRRGFEGHPIIESPQR